MPILNSPNLDELEEVHDDDDLMSGLAGHHGANDFGSIIGDESGAFRIAAPSLDHWGEADLTITTKQQEDEAPSAKPPPVIPSLMPVTRPMMSAVRAPIEVSAIEAERRRAFQAAKPVQIESVPPDERAAATTATNAALVHRAPPTIVERPQFEAPSLAPPPPKQDNGPKRYGTLKMEAVPTSAAAAPPPPVAHDASPASSGRMLDDPDWASAPSIDLELSALPSGQMKAAIATSTETMAGNDLQTLSNTSVSSNSGVVRFAMPLDTPMDLLGVPPTASGPTSRGASREMPAVQRPPSRQMQAVQGEQASAVAGPPSSNNAPNGGTSARISASDGMAPVNPLDRRRPGVYAFAGYGVAPTSWIDAPTYALRVLTRQKALRRELAMVRARRGRTDEVALFEEALEAADQEAYKKGVTVLGLIVGLATAAVITAIVFMLA